MALPWAQRIVLERKIARWVWEEKRAIAIQEIADRFCIDVPSVRIIVRLILRRTDGIKCSLSDSGFEVHELPESYQPFIMSCDIKNNHAKSEKY
ncbi:hypothetical protein E3O66_15890 [Salmonella enterica subsp. enterica serovar Oslo]|nr:hypothetical protein [Salmonella enterica subsp. enterica serovar Oslo]ECG6796585.1 hypothetical protein [Salmonella enterica subsp. enterica serovar Oslo]EGM7047638.1 hypothetical protein [Salmonella enterica subsp. enterica serovar Oslo]EHI5301494.1 hypothetical protein [Salmonella enterica]